MSSAQLGHVVLYVRDVDASRAFYADLLGWPVVAELRTDGARAVAISSGRTHHELLLVESRADVPHLAGGGRAALFRIGVKIGEDDGDLRAMLRRVIAHRVPLVGSADHTITHSLYVLDPDGNEIELYVDAPGIDWATNPDVIISPLRPLDL